MARNAVWLFSIFLLCGCGMVTDKQAAEEFKKAHPQAMIYQQFVGEGNSDFAYMHFRYTESGDPKKLEQVWGYARQPDNSWKVAWKADPKAPGSDFGD